jgi:WhiB family transcriptional regulator, redox-sensing transcriptional regulator
MADSAALPALIGDHWDWQVRAACRGLNADLFFNPDYERGRPKRLREENAKAVCRSCPVLKQCLEWAVAVGEPYGIWGGMTPAERQELRERSYLATAD